MKNENSAVIRAKISIHKIDGNIDGKKNNEQISGSAVYSPDPKSENAQFARATPYLSLNMQIDNEGAFDKLISGDEYYLDFIPVKKAETKE